MIHVPVLALTAVIGSLVPFLVGLVGHQKSGAVRSVLNALLSAVAGGATLALAQGGRISLGNWVLNVALAWGASVVSYHGLLNPTGVIDAVVTFVAKVLAKVGIKIPVPAVETDLENLVAQLEALLMKHAAPPVAVPVTNATPTKAA
jgi:hypothetical protein